MGTKRIRYEGLRSRIEAARQENLEVRVERVREGSSAQELRLCGTAFEVDGGITGSVIDSDKV